MAYKCSVAVLNPLNWYGNMQVLCKRLVDTRVTHARSIMIVCNPWWRHFLHGLQHQGRAHISKAFNENGSGCLYENAKQWTPASHLLQKRHSDRAGSAETPSTPNCILKSHMKLLVDAPSACLKPTLLWTCSP